MSKPLDWLFPQKKRPLMILDTIDIQYQRESRLKPLREECAFDYEKEKQLELEYLGKYDMLLGITDLDSDEMRSQLKDKPVRTIAVEAVIPETCRVDEDTYDDIANEKAYDLSFIGANNEANRFSVLHLLKEIVPPLVERLPDVTIALAGEVCADPEIAEAAEIPNVQLLNYVDSLEEFFKKSKALIAPIVAGGGVKLKILEALSHGVPVLTTPIGAEGISIKDGRQGYITADDKKLVDNAVSLLNSPETLKRMSIRAQRFVKENHAAQVVYKEIDEALEKHLDS